MAHDIDWNARLEALSEDGLGRLIVDGSLGILSLIHI